jgi:hypothetical protein
LTPVDDFFSTVRDPVVMAIREAGWEFVPVLNRKHAKYEKEAVE